MMQSRTRLVVGSVLGCLIALTALAVGGFGPKADGQGNNERNVAVPAEQVIASIRTAIAARPGNVRAIETETEAGKTICEVKILGQDGRTYEVEVDVAANTVIEVEVDDDNDNEDGDDDN